MLDAVSGAGGGVFGQFRPPAISAEQGAQLTELLSNYDAENLSPSDAEALVSDIRELGIRPGRELAAALNEEGFDARELADRAGVERPRRDKAEHTRPFEAAINEILNDFDLSNLSKEDKTELRTRLQEAGFGSKQNAVDISV